MPDRDPRLKRLERLSHLLDDSIRIPLIGYRIGWDAIIGLIPGIGDVAGLLLSAYVVLEAARFRVPKATLARMVANVGIEGLVGLVPVLGDVFDATFKANLRNLDLLHEHVGVERRALPAERRSRAGVVAVVGVALAAVVGVIALVIAGLVAVF